MNGRFRVGNAEAPQRVKQGIWIRPNRHGLIGGRDLQEASFYDGLGPMVLNTPCRCDSRRGVRLVEGVYCRRCGRLAHP